MNTPTQYDFGSNGHISHLTERLAKCERLRRRTKRSVPALDTLTKNLRLELAQAENTRIRREKEEFMVFDVDFNHGVDV